MPMQTVDRQIWASPLTLGPPPRYLPFGHVEQILIAVTFAWVFIFQRTLFAGALGCHTLIVPFNILPFCFLICVFVLCCLFGSLFQCFCFFVCFCAYSCAHEQLYNKRILFQNSGNNIPTESVSNKKPHGVF